MPNKFTKSFNEAYESEMKSINEQLDQNILFVLIGNINSGKSSTINALMGDQVATVSARPGETVAVDEYQYANKILFVDTPGLNDVIEDNSDKTLDYYKNSDIILFFLNAAGDVLSSTEKKAFDKIKKYNSNILIVLNKIDAAEDIETIVCYINAHLGEQYPVIPISSKTGENIEQLKGEILDILTIKKKEILFAKNVKEKNSIANKWIVSASTAAGAIGVTPFPGADIIPITAVQIGMLLKLSHLYDDPISKERAREIIITTIAGNTGRAVYHQLLKMFPGYGSLIGGGVAGSITFALGQAVKYSYENKIDLNPESLRSIYKLMTKK